MQLKAAKFAALFARLRSAFPLMASLALFAALPRTASAATFPTRTGNMPDTLITEDTPTVPYYTDGSTKYAFSTWVNLLRAVGWDAANGRLESGVSAAGGTAGDPLKVTLYNLTDKKPSELGCKYTIDWESKKEYWLYESGYGFGYTHFEFNGCHFRGGKADTDKMWGTTRSRHQGLKLSFVDCIFGEADGIDGGVLDKKNLCMAIYTSDGGLNPGYIFDYTFDGCTIHKLQGQTPRMFGGSECGHLLVTNCYLDVYVNAQPNGVASDGQKPTFTVADCTISDRITKNPGWMVGVLNKGFQSYSVSGLKYSDDATDVANRGQPLDVVFYKSLNVDDNNQGVEYHFENGKVLNSMGGESTTGRAEFSCQYTPDPDDNTYVNFEYLVPVHVTYDANGGTGTPPAREGYDKRSKTARAASGSGLTNGGASFIEWNTEGGTTAGTPIAAGALIAGGAELGGDKTLYARYGTPVPQYSVDGGVTWNDYPTEGKWQAVIDAYRNHCKSGASATEELVGGTSEKQGTILVRNVVFDAVDQLDSRRYEGWQYCICSYRDHLQYTTIRFDNCTFDKMSSSYGCFGPGAMGQKMEFVNCDFYSDLSLSKYAENALYSGTIVPDDADRNSYYPIDISLDNCRALVFNGGGPCIGDLSVVNCSFRLNVNGHIEGGPFGVNSFGNPSTCHIENLQPQPGAAFTGETPADNKLFSSWTCSFARYEVSGSEGYITTAYRSWRHEIPNSGGKNYPRDIRGEVPGDKDKLNVLNSVSDSVVIEPQNETEARWPSDKRGIGHGVFLEYSLAGPTPPTTPHEFFVKPAGEGGAAANSGADWDHATTLLSAIAKAADADQPVTIYVKEGTYSEGSGSDIIASIGTSHTQPITILGGCTGVGTAQGTGYSLYQASSRNSTDQRPKWLKRSSDSTCALTISRVKVKLYDQGAFVEGSGNFTMTDCHFIRNGDHGALCAKTTGHVTLLGCEFRGNLIAGNLNANVDTTVWDDRYFAPVVIEANATIEHCAFVANVACSLYTWNCGGLGVGGTGTTVSIDFCTFAYNICAKTVNKVAQDSCCVAGLSLGGSASVTVDNSIFVNPERTDDEPDARFICGCADEEGDLLYTGYLTLGYVLIPSGVNEVGPTGKEWQKGIWKIAQNRVTWNSTKVTIGEAQLVDKTSFWSTGNPDLLGMNVGDNARFRVSCLDAETIDIHPLSAGGHYQAGGEWVSDYITSPAVDRGDPAVAYSNEPSPNGGRVNLGYYGNTAEASKTPSVTFDQKGGTGGAGPVSPTVGATMPTISGTPTLANHRFAGYSREGWEVVTMTGRDTDIYNIGTLTYAYCPTAVSGGIKLNGVKFESLLAASATAFGQIEVSATTRSSDGGSGSVGKSGDYQKLMNHKLLVQNVDQITVTLKGLEKDHSYLMQLVCHEGVSGYKAGFNIDGVNYECNSKKATDIQYGRSFVLRFKATGSSYSFPLKKIDSNGFIHINAIQVRDITSLGSLQYYDGTGASVREYPVVDRPAKLYAQWVSHEFFVKPTGQGGAASNSGANWENATTLSSAIANAANADQPVTIYVHEGTYKEGAGISEVIASIGSAHTQPITILGGCTGTTGTDKSRGTGHSVYQPTDASIVTTSRPIWLQRATGANCSLAISQVDVREYSTGAYVVGSGDFSLTNCNFIKNGDTGALYAKLTSGKTSLYGCEFRGNLITESGWSGYGSPTVIESDAVIAHCAFIANQSYLEGNHLGGGIGVGGTANVTMSFCTFAYNIGKQWKYNGKNLGHVILAGAPNVVIENSLFARVSGEDDPRAIRRRYGESGVFDGHLKVSYTVFQSETGTYKNIDGFPSSADIQIDNIVHGNAVLVSEPSCTVEGSSESLHPHVPNPNYYWIHSVDPESIDIHLKSVAGHWNGTGWTPDGVTSPAIDAGDPAEDYSNEPMPNGGCVNLGYYGNTAQASKSPYARVRLNANGGTPEPDPATVTVTAGQTMPHLVEGQTNITRSGYAFLGYGRAGWEVKPMTGNMTDFIDEGESVWAYRAYNGYQYDVTLNETVFKYGLESNTGKYPRNKQDNPDFTTDAHFTSFSDNINEETDFSGVPDGDYKNVVRSRIKYEDHDKHRSVTFTLNGLEDNKAYAVQIISYNKIDNTPGNASYRFGFRDDVYYLSGYPDNPMGVSFVYRFVSTDSTHTFKLYKPESDFMGISAVQLRELGDASVLDVYYDANGNSLKSYPAENGPTELFAQWAPVYTITFRANGGKNADFTHDVALGAALPNATPATPPVEATGVNFTGYYDINDVQWYDASGAPLAGKSPYALSDNLTLYAHWDAKAYYKVGGDDSLTSFERSADPEHGVGWALTPDGSPIVHTVSSGCDYYVIAGGATLATPEDASATVHAFAGKSLTIAHAFFVKENVSFDKLIVKSGIICNGKNERVIGVSGSIEIPAGYTLDIDITRANRTLDLNGTVTGGGTIRLMGENNSEDANGVYRFSGDFSGFTGNIGPYYNDPRNGCSLVFTADKFNGRLEGVPSTMTNVCFNYEALDSSRGLLVGPVTATEVGRGDDTLAPLKTRVTLYSATADFNARFFPLMTFPAGTAVDPTQFTVSHATSANGEKTAFRNLGVRTNGDGTITLVANSVLSAIRENGPEIHFWNLDWIAEVCSTGTTAADYQAAFLKTNAQGVVTWQAYVLGYEPNEVATAAILEESVQNANPETVTIRLVDLPTNPRTNDMVGVRYALLAARSTGDFAAGNAKVVVNLDDDPYEFWPVSTFEAPLRDLTDEEPVNYYQIKVRFFFNRPIYDNEVEWLRIESQDDDDYIDTGIKITHDMRIETKVMLETSRQSYSRFGFDDSIVKGQSEVGDKHGFTRIMFSVAQDTACFGFQSSGNVISAGFVSVDEVKNNELVIAGDYDQYTVNNKTYDTYSTHIDDDPVVGTMKLMAFGNGRFSTGEFAGKMWYFRLYKGDELIADFVPVKITTDDGGVEYAMYDKVGGMLHRNHGTGSFTGGPAVQ